MNFLNQRKGGVHFPNRFSFFSLFQCTVMHYRNCKRLREFEEIEQSGCSGESESQVENS